jgi:hypothetical protein
VAAAGAALALMLAHCARTEAPTDGAVSDLSDLPGVATADAPTGDAGDALDAADGAACQPVVGFKTCAEPVEVRPEGGRFCGDTSMTDNLYTLTVDPATGCDRPSPEPEYVFRFSLAQTATVEARARGDFRIALYLRRGCIDETMQVGCAQSVASGDAAVLTLDRLEAGVYYLFVDGAGEPDAVGQNRGPFELSIDVRP